MICKVQSSSGDKRFGIVAGSLASLKEQASSKLKLKTKARNVRIVQFEDGTEITDDDYLSSLPPQTVFVALESSEDWKPGLSDLNELLRSLEAKKKHLLDLANEARYDPHIQEMVMNITSLSERSQAIAESRADDPDWFEDVEKRFTKKEDVMRSAAERRMRGYLRLVQDSVTSEKDSKSKAQLNVAVQNFKDKLSEDRFNGDYFARSSEAAVRLCDSNGWFRCEGLHDEDKCSHSHIINPYASKEMRILFSTWNLDHKIEKSRQVIPSMHKAVSDRKTNQTLNWLYFYNLLFTRNNLKLVHIVCHDKRLHPGECDPRQYYCNSKKN